MGELEDPQVIVDGPITSKALELTNDAKSEYEKIQAIGTYVKAFATFRSKPDSAVAVAIVRIPRPRSSQSPTATVKTKQICCARCLRRSYHCVSR